MKFKNNYNSKPQADENIIGHSQTIPNQSMSLREILNRFASGLPVTGEKVPVYDGEDLDTPDLSRLDKVDREQLKKDLKSELKSIKDKFNQAQVEELANKRAKQLLAEKQLKSNQTDEPSAEGVHPIS